MPAFWSSKPKAPPINTSSAPTSNPTDDLSVRALSTTTQATRSSEENDTTSGQTTPKPSGLDNRIPSIPSVSSALLNHPLILKLLQSPISTPRQTTSAGNEGLTEVPPPAPATPPAVAPVGPPKGKLTVKILQAKNLKVSRPDVFALLLLAYNHRLRRIVCVCLKTQNSFLEVQ